MACHRTAQCVWWLLFFPISLWHTLVLLVRSVFNDIFLFDFLAWYDCGLFFFMCLLFSSLSDLVKSFILSVVLYDTRIWRTREPQKKTDFHVVLFSTLFFVSFFVGARRGRMEIESTQNKENGNQISLLTSRYSTRVHAAFWLSQKPTHWVHFNASWHT